MNCNERADLTGSRMLPNTTAADLLAQATGAGEPTVVDELAPTGRLAVVERTGPVGKAAIYCRAEEGFGRRDLFDATPPVLAGFQPQPGFAF